MQLSLGDPDRRFKPAESVRDLGGTSQLGIGKTYCVWKVKKVTTKKQEQERKLILSDRHLFLTGDGGDVFRAAKIEDINLVVLQKYPGEEFGNGLRVLLKFRQRAAEPSLVLIPMSDAQNFAEDTTKRSMPNDSMEIVRCLNFLYRRLQPKDLPLDEINLPVEELKPGLDPREESDPAKFGPFQKPPGYMSPRDKVAMWAADPENRVRPSTPVAPAPLEPQVSQLSQSQHEQVPSVPSLTDILPKDMDFDSPERRQSELTLSVETAPESDYLALQESEQLSAESGLSILDRPEEGEVYVPKEMLDELAPTRPFVYRKKMAATQHGDGHVAQPRPTLRTVHLKVHRPQLQPGAHARLPVDDKTPPAPYPTSPLAKAYRQDLPRPELLRPNEPPTTAPAANAARAPHRGLRRSSRTPTAPTSPPAALHTFPNWAAIGNPVEAREADGGKWRQATLAGFSPVTGEFDVVWNSGTARVCRVASGDIRPVADSVPLAYQDGGETQAGWGGGSASQERALRARERVVDAERDATEAYRLLKALEVEAASGGPTLSAADITAGRRMVDQYAQRFTAHTDREERGGRRARYIRTPASPTPPSAAARATSPHSYANPVGTQNGRGGQRPRRPMGAPPPLSPRNAPPLRGPFAGGHRDPGGDWPSVDEPPQWVGDSWAQDASPLPIFNWASPGTSLQTDPAAGRLLSDGWGPSRTQRRGSGEKIRHSDSFRQFPQPRPGSDTRRVGGGPQQDVAAVLAGPGGDVDWWRSFVSAWDRASGPTGSGGMTDSPHHSDLESTASTATTLL